MAITPKVLGQATPAGAVEAAVYTVPAATSATVSSIIIHNTDASNTDTAKVRIDPGSVASTLDKQICDINVPPSGTVILTVGITLAATDRVWVQSSNGDVNFHLFGIEEA